MVDFLNKRALLRYVNSHGCKKLYNLESNVNTFHIEKLKKLECSLELDCKARQAREPNFLDEPHH